MQRHRRARKPVVPAIAIAILLLLVSSLQPVLGAAPAAGNEPSKFAVTRMIKGFLTERAAHLVAQRPEAAAGGTQLSLRLSDKVKAHGSVLDARRERLKQLGTEYTNATVEVEIKSSTLSGDRLTVSANELTKFTFKRIHGDEPDFTAYREDHVFTLVRSNGVWELASQAPAAREGLPPITEVIESADDPAIDPDSSSPERPSGPLPKDDKLASARPNGGITSMAIPAGLNYVAMKDYALTYWDNYNGAYRTFPNDCTNFISQSLRHGGWVDKTGFYQDNNNWWYGLVTQTYTWGGAQNWSIFAPQRTTLLANAWSMGIADILQLDFDKDGSKDHTMIVTKKDSTNIYLTYHTSDHINRPMTELQTLYSNSAWWYSYRT